MLYLMIHKITKFMASKKSNIKYAFIYGKRNISTKKKYS